MGEETEQGCGLKNDILIRNERMRLLNCRQVLWKCLHVLIEVFKLISTISLILKEYSDLESCLFQFFRINTTDCLLKIAAMSNVVLNMIRFLKLLDSITFYALGLRTKTLNYFQNLISISTRLEVPMWCDLSVLALKITVMATEILLVGELKVHVVI